MSIQEIKLLQEAKSKAERELGRLRAQLVSRDELLRRMRAEQQWTAEALEAVHVPLLAFDRRGELFWSNLAAQVLLGLDENLSQTATEQLPPLLRDGISAQFAATQQRNRPIQLALKLRGQVYRVNMQNLQTGAAAKALNASGMKHVEALWMVSLVPEHSEALAATVPYPDLPEVAFGEDKSAISLQIPMGEGTLPIQVQPVLGLQKFLGIEQLARIEYEAPPSVNLDLALINALSERLLSDRLGVLDAGAWMLRLSTDVLHERDFASRLIATLGRYQLDGSRFVFGLPESEVMDALVLMKQLQADLKYLSVRWALLETSADLSNFEYLAPLGLDFYCISPDFVAQACAEKRSENVLRALHDAASAQGMATFASGVNSPAAMTTVRAVGIDYVCGDSAHEALLND